MELDTVALDRFKQSKKVLLIETKWVNKVNVTRAMSKLKTKIQQSKFSSIKDKWIAVISRGFLKETGTGIEIANLIEALTNEEILQFQKIL